MHTRGFIFASYSCIDVYGLDDKLIGSLMSNVSATDDRWFVVRHNWWGEPQDVEAGDCGAAVVRYKHTHQYRLDPHFDALGCEAFTNPEVALEAVRMAEQLHRAGGKHARIVG